MSGTLQMTFDNAVLEFPDATYDYMEDPTVLKVTLGVVILLVFCLFGNLFHIHSPFFHIMPLHEKSILPYHSFLDGTCRRYRFRGHFDRGVRHQFRHDLASASLRHRRQLPLRLALPRQIAHRHDLRFPQRLTRYQRPKINWGIRNHVTGERSSRSGTVALWLHSG